MVLQLFCAVWMVNLAAAGELEGRLELPPNAVSKLSRLDNINDILDGIERTKSIGWEAAPASPEAESPAPIYLARASLLERPAVSPVSLHYRSCDEVRREAKEIKKITQRLIVLRKEIEGRLRSLARRCLRRSDCDSPRLRRDLGEMDLLVSRLDVYARRELEAPLDRLVSYRFAAAGYLAPRLLARGFRVAEVGAITRMREFGAPWMDTPSGLPENYEALTFSRAGEWRVHRRLRASEACLRNPNFGFDLLTTWENSESGETRKLVLQVRAAGHLARIRD